MNEKMIQETMQQTFEQECRGYAYYIEAYHSLFDKVEYFEKEIDTLEEEETTIENTLKVKEYLESEEFESLKKVLKNPDTNEFATAVSDFIETNKSRLKKIELQVKELRRKKKELYNLLSDKKEVLSRIRKNIFDVLYYAAENDATLVVTKEISDVAYKAFVEYYKDTYNFRKNRKIIDIANSILPEEFVKAYITDFSNGDSMEDEDKALKWFEKEAKKINF